MIKGVRKEAYLCERYVPGKSMDEVKEAYGLTSVVKLGSNENAYGPFEHTKLAMASEINRLNIYPEKNFIKLKNLLGEKYGLDGSYIGLGHGAGGVLETLAKTFLEAGDEVIIPKESYRLYREISKMMGAVVKEIPLDSDYSMNLDDFKVALTPKCKLIWLCNPNNPTGSLFDKEKFEELVSALPESTWIVLDEAYAEFAPNELLPNGIDCIKQHKNVICVRTFSKYYGLAGGRIGYLIADPELITCYDTVSEPFNANRIGLAGAVSIIEHDLATAKTYGDRIVADRERISEQLTEMGCVVSPSYANFVFFSTPYPATEIAEQLMRRGVIVRPCGGWGYDRHIRVTVGNTEENDIFLSELKAVLEANASAKVPEISV